MLIVQYSVPVRRTPQITIPLEVQPSSSTLPTQLTAQIRKLIGSQVLAPGDPVPSSRALAAHLGISRGSVIAAYDQLLSEGYLSAKPGQATIVNPQLGQVHPPALASAPHHAPPAPRTDLLDLRPGRPWVGEWPDAAWKAAWRRASSRPVDSDSPALGLEGLRQAWADHLRRMRAVVRDPAQITVTAGGREGLALILHALGPGSLRVGVEDPGYPSLRRVPHYFGASVQSLPADEHGLVTSALPTGSAAPAVVLVTPSHQYPLGGSLPIDRRSELLAWAEHHRVVVIEDDYDSELRYTSSPLPALAALDDPATGRVVLLSTLAKTLTPALATGFLALPEWLVPPVTRVREELGQPIGQVTQNAMADYLASGALRLHTQRMRQRYRRRRAEVVAALRDLPGLRVYPMDGGLHAVVETARDEAAVVADLAAHDVQVSALSTYWSGRSQRRGIVFGFGAVTADELHRALTLIAHYASVGQS